MKSKCNTLLLIMLMLCSPLLAQSVPNDKMLPSYLLKQVGEPIEIPGYVLTSVNSKDGDLYIAIMSQGGRNVTLLEKDGTFCRRWSIKERGNLQRIAASNTGELFIASASPNIGYYYSLKGELQHTLKLFRNGSFTFGNDGSAHVSTFSATSQNREEIGYWVMDRLGEEKLFVDVLAQIDENERLFFTNVFKPFVQKEFVYILARPFPFLVKLDKRGKLLNSTFIDSPRFKEKTLLNLNGNASYQFFSMDRLEDDILVSHIVEKGSIELLRISTEGKLLAEYRIDGLQMADSAMGKICVLQEAPLKVAVLDGRTDLLRILEAVESDVGNSSISLKANEDAGKKESEDN